MVGKAGSRHSGKVGYLCITLLLDFLHLQLMFLGQDFFLLFDIRLKIDVVDDFVVRLILILLGFESTYLDLQLVLQLLFSDLIAGGFRIGNVAAILVEENFQFVVPSGSGSTVISSITRNVTPGSVVANWKLFISSPESVRFFNPSSGGIKIRCPAAAFSAALKTSSTVALIVVLFGLASATAESSTTTKQTRSKVIWRFLAALLEIQIPGKERQFSHRRAPNCKCTSKAGFVRFGPPSKPSSNG